MNTEIDQLLYDLNLVRMNKFNLSQRLGHKIHLKAFSVNLLSLVTVFSSIVILAQSLEDIQVTQAASILIAGASVLNIIISISSPSEILALRSRDAHNCGQSITAIYRKLKFGKIDVVTANSQYLELMGIHNDNHASCDYNKSRYDLRHKNPEKSSGASFLNGPALYYFSAALPILIMIGGCMLILFAWKILNFTM